MTTLRRVLWLSWLSLCISLFLSNLIVCFKFELFWDKKKGNLCFLIHISNYKPRKRMSRNNWYTTTHQLALYPSDVFVYLNCPPTTLLQIWHSLLFILVFYNVVVHKLFYQNIVTINKEVIFNFNLPEIAFARLFV